MSRIPTFRDRYRMTDWRNIPGSAFVQHRHSPYAILRIGIAQWEIPRCLIIPALLFRSWTGYFAMPFERAKA